jgi:hypothetical protein
MLTLQPDPENVQICILKDGKRRTPIYWHPKIKSDLRSTVENLQSFNTPAFRDRFELSRDQSNRIFDSLRDEVVCKQHQSKYFKCKEWIQASLLSEMNIEDQSGEFVIPFPPGTDFCGHELVVGSTNAGKTFLVVQKILANLKGPKADRRKFVYFSAEWNRDKTLEPLRNKKFSEYVDGVDCSEDGFRNSQYSTPEEFFLNEIKIRCAQRNCVLIWDDSQDMCCPDLIRPLINSMMRVARHQNISLIVLLHSIRSAAWSSQSHQSCKYITLFPRSQKGKIRDYVNQDLGLTLPESRDLVKDFAQLGRVMTISLHCPQVCIGPKLIRLI